MFDQQIAVVILREGGVPHTGYTEALVKILRFRRDDYQINVIVCGFSTRSHLSAACAVGYDACIDDVSSPLNPTPFKPTNATIPNNETSPTAEPASLPVQVQ